MFLIGVLPAFLLLWIRTGVREPDLWADADERRRAARERKARGEELRPEEHGLVRFTMHEVVATPALRRRLAFLLGMSLACVVGWWAVSSWIPLYAGQNAARAGLDQQQWAALTGLVYNLGMIVGYLMFGVLADVWGRKPTTLLYYVGSFVMVVILFQLVHDPGLLLVAAAVNGFFTSGIFAWMPIYLPELFPTHVRGSAISIVFDSSRYLAAAGPLLAGWLITTLGGIPTAAVIFGSIYLLGLVLTPFAGPETKG